MISTTAGSATEAEYRRRTPGSRLLYQRALQSLPGGDTRAGTFYRPYPTYMERGSGFDLYDVDGNQYLDLLNNYTSLVHGHAVPAVVRATVEQSAKGTVHGAPCAAQIALAEAIRHRVPMVAQLRFTNSGTEAVMCAVRAARAFTGKARILKMEGGYHGIYDAAEVSVDPGAESRPWPAGVPDGPGLSPGMTDEVLVAPFNDLERAAVVIREHRHELAAVMVEPMMNAAGMIPADPEFLAGLREITRECGVLLIMDEIVTFRLAPGGGQQLYGVEADLVTLGKIIGGGLPVGAFGGRADVMKTYDPTATGSVFHSGTFNGNPTTMVAGLASLDLLTAAAIERINRLGEDLRHRLTRSLVASSIGGVATGRGSLIHLHLGPAEVRDYRAAAAGRRALYRTLHLALLNRGIFAAPRGMLALSTVMDESVVELVAAAVSDALGEIASG